MKQLIFVSIFLIISISYINYIAANNTITHYSIHDNFKIKMIEANNKVKQEDYYGALRIYRELYRDYEDNAILNYKMGECYVAINDMNNAITYLNNSLIIDSLIDNHVYFLLGKSYQYIEQLDKAIGCYYKFKLSLSEKQNEKHEVNYLLQQCITAKEMMTHPANVNIYNLGPNINSKYADACPSITADGKTFIFTSRRNENVGSLINPETEEYYDDIYIATWNDTTKEFNKAINIGSPINTKEHDANTSISPDGTQIFIYKNIEGITRSGDIYLSKKKPDGTWTTPKSIDENNINSSYFESSACVTADGNTMYFVSERGKTGYGNSDIYMSKKLNNVWQKPTNLGSIINTKYDEITVYVHPDGKTLFFSSNGHNTMGGYDIFMSNFENGNWTKPINIGYPINTTKDEYHFALSTDRNSAFISSSREGGFGKSDIYKVDMSNYFNSSIKPNPTSILKGIITNNDFNEPVETIIEIIDLANGSKNYTSSNDKGEYSIVLQIGNNYKLTINTEEYKTYSTNINTSLKKKDITLIKK